MDVDHEYFPPRQYVPTQPLPRSGAAIEMPPITKPSPPIPASSLKTVTPPTTSTSTSTSTATATATATTTTDKKEAKSLLQLIKHSKLSMGLTIGICLFIAIAICLAIILPLVIVKGSTVIQPTPTITPTPTPLAPYPNINPAAIVVRVPAPSVDNLVKQNLRFDAIANNLAGTLLSGRNSKSAFYFINLTTHAVTMLPIPTTTGLNAFSDGDSKSDLSTPGLILYGNTSNPTSFNTQIPNYSSSTLSAPASWTPQQISQINPMYFNIAGYVSATTNLISMVPSFQVVDVYIQKTTTAYPGSKYEITDMVGSFANIIDNMFHMVLFTGQIIFGFSDMKNNRVTLLQWSANIDVPTPALVNIQTGLIIYATMLFDGTLICLSNNTVFTYTKSAAPNFTFSLTSSCPLQPDTTINQDIGAYVSAIPGWIFIGTNNNPYSLLMQMDAAYNINAASVKKIPITTNLINTNAPNGIVKLASGNLLLMQGDSTGGLEYVFVNPALL